MSNAKDQRQRLVAILAADAAGYSRLIAIDASATVHALDDARQVFRAAIESHQGRVIDMAGDSVLAVFETAIGAVETALEVQQQLAAIAADLPEEQRMRFRIGVHLGDVIEKPDGTVYGDGVNIAARLQALAEPGGITASAAVRGALRNRVPATFADQGEQRVKNILDPVHAFGLKVEPAGRNEGDGNASFKKTGFLIAWLTRAPRWVPFGTRRALLAAMSLALIGTLSAVGWTRL